MNDKLFQNYFSQIANPEYRQAQQQQNLFSNLLQYGAQMRAAGAPTTNVGQPALLASRALGTLGQNMNKGNQAYQNQIINAIKLKSLMRQNELAQEKRKNIQAYAETLPPGKARAAVLAGFKPIDNEKFGTFTVIKDDNSKTGWSKIQINQKGEQRVVGEAADPAAQWRPYQPQPMQLQPTQPSSAQPSSAQPSSAQPSVFKLGSFGVPVSEGTPYVGVDRTTAGKMMVQERNKFNTNLEKKRISLTSQEKMLERLNRFKQLMGAGMGTGLEKAGPLKNAWGWDDKTAEGKAIQDELTPLMRQGLPGAASDRDVAMFAGATVGIGKPEETNLNIIKAVEIRTKLYQDKLNFEQDYFAQNKHTFGMDAAWQKYLEANKIFDPTAPMGEYKLNQNRMGYKEWFKTGHLKSKTPKTENIGEPPSSVSRDQWEAMTADERKAWPKGK